MIKLKNFIRTFLIKIFKLDESRKNIENALLLSEKRFNYLFEHNPQPLWIYDIETLSFLHVNRAAIGIYGYSREEFLKMTIKDIRPREDVNKLLDDVTRTTDLFNRSGEWRHIKKNGEIINVEIVSHYLEYESRKARLVLVNDITKQKLSEQKLRTLRLAVDQNPASILITDVHGTIEYVNTKFTRLSGYKPEEVIGKNPRILKSGATSSGEYQDLWQTIRSGKEWRGYFQNIKKNGEKYYEAATILPIVDENGRISHFLAIKEDVTSRIQSEKQIKTLSKAVEQSPTSIIITNADGKIEFVNSKFTSFMQYSLNDVRGRNPRIFNPGHMSPESYETMWEYLRAKKVWQGEFVNRKKDWTYFWENVTVAPLLDENGSISNYILVMEDITEKKKMIRELIDAKEKAQESDRLKTAFLQNMSHEIRTPMNAIIGFSDLLPDEFDNKEKLQKYTRIIKQRSSDLLDIINEILDIARIESGQFPINLEECDLHAMFTELETFFNEYRERIYKQHIGFKLNCNPEIRMIVTDPVKLKQVLINLISNAFKFTHSGIVEVGCEPSADNEITFHVSDTGIGIPEDKKAEIFERFKQANTDTTKLYGGTGLGLSIVKGILDLLGGTIRVESESGVGSTFRFTIPDMTHSKNTMTLIEYND